jgi:4-aminobutyrate aminotransferase-like enzyme/aminoglycoside phosphotransferase (APT) family kinase protein
LLPALRTSPPSAVDPAAAAGRVLDAYGIDAKLYPLAGERDANFRLRTADGRELVLKIIDPSADPVTVDCQVSVLRHLAKHDPALPVPRLIPTRDGADWGRWGGRAMFLIGFLPGRVFGGSPVPQALMTSLGDALARLDRALAGFDHAGLAQPLAWDVRRLPELAGFAPMVQPRELQHCLETVIAQFVRRLPALQALPSQAIHGDCHAGNLLVDDAGRAVLGILDFGDMLRAPAAFEPAVAMSELLTEGLALPDELAALVAGYARRSPLKPAELASFYDVILARHAATILIHAWRLRHDAAGAAALDASAARAAGSLDRLLAAGREALTRAWSEDAHPVSSEGGLLRRRRRMLGAGAELFYDRPLHLVRGEGVWLHGADGRRYLDVYNNVAHVGHSHPAVVEAIHRQTALLATHTRYLHERVLEYAEQLTARLPPPLEACIFVNSGSEANDVAWRIARAVTGRTGALVMEHAYHGVTDAIAALSPAAGAAAGHAAIPHVATLPAPPRGLGAGSRASAAQLEAAMAAAQRAIADLNARGHPPAAFFLDTAFTSSGIHDPPPEWLAALLAPVRAAGALCVADEVQYGLGRSGSHFWGFERRGLRQPDLVTLGKPVGNGFPLGAVIGARALIEDFQARSGFFSTFGGNPVAAAAGLAVLEVLEREQLAANAGATGAHLSVLLEALAGRHACVGAIRGAGLLLGMEIVGSAGEPDGPRARRIVNRLAVEHGVLTGTDGAAANVLKLRPPLPFRREHADLLAAALDAVLAAAPAAAPAAGQPPASR